jgi:hypothetical protein
MRFRFLFCALTIVGVVAAAPAYAQELAVETSSPDALCPDLATTRQAIHNRMGAFEGGTQGWVARYTVGYSASQGSFVRLTLVDPAGQVRLERDLPREGESCATLAQAVAVVIEVFFRDLEPREEQAQPPPQPKPVVVPVKPTPPVEPSLPPRLSPPLTLGVEAGFLSFPTGGFVGAQGGYWALPWFRPMLQIGVGLARRKQTNLFEQDASAHLRAYPIRLTLGFGQRSKELDWFVGPTLRATFAATSVEGLKSNSAGESGVDGYWSTGLAAGALWWPTSNVALTLNLAADARFAGTDFQVTEGQGNEGKSVLDVPTLQFTGTLGIAIGVRP